MKTFIMATLAMLAFAANSVIARLALSEHGIDPGSFTLLRLIAGERPERLHFRGRFGNRIEKF